MINKDLVCVVCPMGCRLTVSGSIENMQVSGGKCQKGEHYAHDEITNPLRMVCTTVKIEGGIHPVIPVKTDKAIPDKYKLEVVNAVKDITLKSPMKRGEIIIPNLFNTGVNLIAERDM